MYGIEMYGAIDAYSRYVLWIYVGISSRTQVSVVSPILDCVEELEYQSCFVRSDRGDETPLIADAHNQLRCTIEPNLEFKECYLFGTSMANQKMEHWWGQLTRGYEDRWRVCCTTTF